MITIQNHPEFESYLGKEIGISGWHTITQDQINKFAEATIDYQWIHTDPERAKTEGPVWGYYCAWLFNSFAAAILLAPDSRCSKPENADQLQH